MTRTRIDMLKISDALALPAAEAHTQTIVAYGGKGMGKTNLIAVLAEELAATDRKFAIVDPVGVSWGLRHSANGQAEGIRIVILGGIHGDIPIEPSGGAVVADFVSDERESVLVDISRRADGRMWTKDEKIEFVATFATRLYERQGEHRRPLMLLIDEAGRFVPEQAPKGSSLGACIDAIENLVELGRNVGIGVTLITQRSARMKKSVSELAECMIAFRTIGPNSVDAILSWFGEHVAKERWQDLLSQIRSLPIGRALIVSPGWLKFEGVAQIRLRRTLDSSKTPTGKEKRLRASKVPDLDKYRALMSATVEKAEAADPSKMRAKVENTERLLAQSRFEAETLRQRIAAAAAKPAKSRALKSKPIVTDAQLAKLDKMIERMGEYRAHCYGDVIAEITGSLARWGAEWDHGLDRVETLARALAESARAAAAGVAEAIRIDTAQPVATAALAVGGSRGWPKLSPAAPIVAGSGPGATPKGEQGDAILFSPRGGMKAAPRAFLIALAQYGKTFDRQRLHLMAGYQPSGDTGQAIAEMVRRGWLIEQGRQLGITPAGLSALGAFERLPEGPALRDYLLGKSPKMEAALLRVWFDAYPNGLTRKQATERAGYKPSGDTGQAIAKFVRLDWLVEESGDGTITASPALFA